MRDPFLWSIPLGRWFGVAVKAHILFPFVALGLILHTAFYKPYEGYQAPDGLWIDAAIMILLLFVIVLAHEFGHVFGARSRWVEGDAQEVLMWPLGGLASVDIPHNPRAHFLTAAAGPMVNVGICIIAALLLLVAHDQMVQPIWNPFPSGFPVRSGTQLVTLTTWAGNEVGFSPYAPAVWLARTFWLSYFLFLLNVLVVAFPLDGGRMLQAVLWRYVGYRQATLTAVFIGFVMAFVVGLYAIVNNEVLALALALFIYVSCRQQWVMLETGAEESVFGYDFSQGYTSLERDEDPPPRPRRRLSWWQRWLQRRAAKKAQREQEAREAEERRFDELLEKVARSGRDSLTDEELRFMQRISERYKHR